MQTHRTTLMMPESQPKGGLQKDKNTINSHRNKRYKPNSHMGKTHTLYIYTLPQFIKTTKGRKKIYFSFLYLLKIYIYYICSIIWENFTFLSEKRHIFINILISHRSCNWITTRIYTQSKEYNKIYRQTVMFKT